MMRRGIWHDHRDAFWSAGIGFTLTGIFILFTTFG